MKTARFISYAITPNRHIIEMNDLFIQLITLTYIIHAIAQETSTVTHSVSVNNMYPFSKFFEEFKIPIKLVESQTILIIIFVIIGNITSLSDDFG